jgi:hypothetical protein
MEQMVNVTNRDNGYVGYTIPDRGIHRGFSPRETKKISLDELRELSYVPGGEFTLKELLIVGDKTALDALNMEVEPEYFYTEADVKKLLEIGTLDQLEDTLNFAPEGVINLIKDISVKTELPDMRKRELISKKIGFNINNAIMVNKVMEEESEPNAESKELKRKATPITEESTADKIVRKANLPKYKVTAVLK